MTDASESWRKIVEAVRRPAVAGPFCPEELSGLLDEVRAEGMLALVSEAWERAGVLATLEPDAKQRWVTAVLLQKARTVLLWKELAEVLDRLSGERLTPLLLKGAHLAAVYYDDVHLRPMSDLDLCFWDLAEARRAFDLLRLSGYDSGEPGLKGDPWAYDQHLAVLTSPTTRALLEIHGSLIYAPKDRRWERASVLLDERETASVLGKTVWVLKPEANVVYLLAHLLVHHGSVPPTLIHVWDVGLILEKEAARFDWDQLVRLARRSGFGESTAQGLNLVRAVLGCPIPEKVLLAFGAEGGDQEGARITETYRDDLVTGKVLGQIAHARGVLGPVVMAFHMAFPPRAFLRERYPDKQKWPRPLLYPYRWGLQFWKVVRWCVGRGS